ncbi:hypothetical protein ACIP5Y_07615 [Nocardia sp. NPDC088792]|uniref:hypothetical protein n=1 Tax=Nocardia sp. NPDC088792 TaxID=3364332 RepID=UPI0037F89390
MESADYRNVAGWLALRCQNIHGPLYGLRVEYVLGTDNWHRSPIAGPIPLRVSWRGGPTAVAVAELLAAEPDPDMPIRYSPNPIDGPQLNASLELSEVPVVLHSVAPHPKTPTAPLGEDPVWKWPTPMADTGAARDSVIWQLPPTSDGIGEATVIRIPCDIIRDPYWSQNGLFVVDDEFTLPPHPTLDLRSLRRNCEQLADIRLRAADTSWSIEDADRWLDEELNGTRSRFPAALTAVVFRDRCVLRWYQGLRILAVKDNRSTGFAPTSYLPSAIYSAMACIEDHHNPPTQLVVHRFGDETPFQFDLRTDIALPYQYGRQ